MDRFLKRSAPDSPVTTPPKKPKSDAKQGNISAASRAQEFKSCFGGSTILLSLLSDCYQVKNHNVGQYHTNV